MEGSTTYSFDCQQCTHCLMQCFLLFPSTLEDRETVGSRKWEAVEYIRGILERRGGREVESQRQCLIVYCRLDQSVRRRRMELLLNLNTIFRILLERNIIFSSYPEEHRSLFFAGS